MTQDQIENREEWCREMCPSNIMLFNVLAKHIKKWKKVMCWSKICFELASSLPKTTLAIIIFHQNDVLQSSLIFAPLFFLNFWIEISINLSSRNYFNSSRMEILYATGINLFTLHTLQTSDRILFYWPYARSTFFP